MIPGVTHESAEDAERSARHSILRRQMAGPDEW